MKILFYDGACGVCDRLVQFLLAHDRRHELFYAPLQGETSRQHFSTPPDLSTSIFSDGGKNYLRSDALLRAIVALGGFWTLFAILVVIPLPIRNFFYDAFAKHRHQIFGAPNQCRLPTPEESRYFLP
jgi:predicted DCC family thiol-disulfide oxidoreductase YuxK